MEKFSVLMSVYFKEDPNYFKSSLESILINQTLRPTELVLICDGDLMPGLEAVIKEFSILCPEIFKVYRKENGGLGKALNYGLPKCSYDLVARADSDDICKPSRFEKQIQYMSEHPEVGVLSSWVDEFTSVPGDINLVKDLPEYHDEILVFAKTRCPINHPAAIFRKSLVLEVGGYQVDYFPEDYFLWIKLLQNNVIFYNVQESLVWFRFSQDTFKRRGGWKYACDEVCTQINIYKMGFISLPLFIKNVVIRVSTRLMPNSLRGRLYQRFLRKPQSK